MARRRLGTPRGQSHRGNSRTARRLRASRCSIPRFRTWRVARPKPGPHPRADCEDAGRARGESPATRRKPGARQALESLVAKMGPAHISPRGREGIGTYQGTLTVTWEKEAADGWRFKSESALDALYECGVPRDSLVRRGRALCWVSAHHRCTLVFTANCACLLASRRLPRVVPALGCGRA